MTKYQITIKKDFMILKKNKKILLQIFLKVYLSKKI